MLKRFLPQAGSNYARGRNFVPGVVSGLSPYVRHRLITEAEIVGAVLQQHSLEEAEKFIQEICWRTYWKGWLEMRPKVWSEYLQELRTLRARMAEDPDLDDRVQKAERGMTGIGCLDAWANELRQTGHLHNHVRMWFASIWVHTLRLPWQLGADFFMRHLLDGDPASNTLSWRWVCGLQTQGKVYQATADNIERFTNGHYAPHGLLAKDVPLLSESFTNHPPIPLLVRINILQAEKQFCSSPRRISIRRIGEFPGAMSRESSFSRRRRLILELEIFPWHGSTRRSRELLLDWPPNFSARSIVSKLVRNQHWRPCATFCRSMERIASAS